MIGCPDAVQTIDPGKTIDIQNIAVDTSVDPVSVSWTLVDLNTGQPINATGQVCYGTSTALGNMTPGEFSFNFSSHSQNLTGLQPGTQYFYTIKSTTQDGRTCESPVGTFTTDTVTAKVDFPPQSSGSSLPEYQGIPLPSAGQSVTDPATGTTITCLVPGQQHAYSERLALNADGTKYMTDSGQIYTYPGLVLLHDLQNSPSSMNSEHVWSMSDPNLIYGSSNGNLVVYDCAANTVVNTGIAAQTIGPFENGPSTDDCIVVNSGGQMCVIDISNPSSPSTLGCIAEPGGSSFDNAAISINGGYVVADVGSSQIVYDRNLNQIRTLPSGGHGTVAIDCNGNEVFAVADGGQIVVYVLPNGPDYTLPYTNVTGASHFSGTACDRPGWLYGSFNVDFSNNDGDSSSGFAGAVELCPGSSTYEVWANNYYNDPSDPNNYDQQPQAVVSKDGQTIIFTSDENGTTTDYAVTCA